MFIGKKMDMVLKETVQRKMSLAERELARLVASEGASEPRWMKEMDLVGMTRAGKNFAQSDEVKKPPAQFSR